MSPKKITDTDRLEISRLYRQSTETTASLANRYGVSNSTISRLLKNTIPEAEYDELIQQKRGVRMTSEEQVIETIESSNSLSQSSPQSNSVPVDSPSESLSSPVLSETQLSLNMVVEDVEKLSPLVDTSEVASPLPASTIAMETTPTTEDSGTNSRRVRRRSSAPTRDLAPSAGTMAIESALADTQDRSPEMVASVPAPAEILDLDSAGIDIDIPTPAKTAETSPVPRIPILRSARSQPDEPAVNLTDADSVETIADEETEEELNQEDVSVLAAMFGEEIAEGDEEEFEDEEDDEESPDPQLDGDRLLTLDRLHLQVTPLSQATLPRTCYIVIDKFAELIVRPLKDFADLGQIPGEEVQQRTLPIFDSPRVAKRFSNQRTQRVIKVPDSKVFHKTSHHLRSKGITRLLIDGNIYSLN